MGLEPVYPIIPHILDQGFGVFVLDRDPAVESALVFGEVGGEAQGDLVGDLLDGLDGELVFGKVDLESLADGDVPGGRLFEEG